MKTHIFDGREFARNKEEELKLKVDKLKAKGVVPKLISIIVGDDPASVLYVNLKKKAAERIGAQVDIVRLQKNVKIEKLKKLINNFCIHESIHGIMVQLPLPKSFSEKDRDSVLNTISKSKDVDGLRKNSKFAAPTAKAAFYALKESFNIVRRYNNITVVGASGFEGQEICGLLEKEKFVVKKLNSKTKYLKGKTLQSKVVISVTGVPGLIKADMVKDGVILIDVGSPKGDVEKEAYEKASFVSPVPGGVGPVTISCLLENLTEASSLCGE